ncbi:MAG: photosystem reaction center protein H [Bradyrhizobiaceae bacterium]|nr:MAG: photosystem reaction center protein H [Bradyrhizobiaceae bacterium]
MINRPLAAVAVATLLLSPAWAQTQTAPAPGAQTAPAAAPQTRTTTGASPAFTDMQKQSQWLGSQLIGAKVVNNADESIGEINDLLVDDNGMVQAAVIGVGGFLGIGEKDVAVSFKELNVTRQDDGDIDKVSVNYTKDQLKQAPEFKTVADQRSNQNRSTTTGSTGTNATPPASTSPNNTMKK